MLNIYIYDGSFISLLNTIIYLIKNNLKPDNIKNEKYFPNLLENTINLAIYNDEKIIDQIIKFLGKNVLHHMYYVFLSEEENKELILYYFFRNAVKYRYKVIFYRNLKCVNKTLQISSYVSHETHKMKGFLRFKELKNKVLYAEIEPTNDILFLLSCHFVKRLKNEFWIIKDKKRKILSIYDKKQFTIVDEQEFKLIDPEESEDEQKYESLWRDFYKTIGIKERRNERCRRNFMPKKYWKYITEVKEEI